MSEYVPTTDEIRDDYAHMIAPHTTWGEDGFDAWLEWERSVARREGWEACALAIQDGLGAWDAFEHYGRNETEPVNSYRTGADQ